MTDECTPKAGRFLLSFTFDDKRQCIHKVGERAIRDLLALLRDDPRCVEWCLFGTDGKKIEASNNWLPF